MKSKELIIQDGDFDAWCLSICKFAVAESGNGYLAKCILVGKRNILVI